MQCAQHNSNQPGPELSKVEGGDQQRDCALVTHIPTLPQTKVYLHSYANAHTDFKIKIPRMKVISKLQNNK